MDRPTVRSVIMDTDFSMTRRALLVHDRAPGRNDCAVGMAVGLHVAWQSHRDLG